MAKEKSQRRDLSDKCLRNMGFSPCATVISREARAEAHATVPSVGHNRRGFIRFTMLVLSLLAGSLAAAEDAEIEVSIGADEIFFGESVDYQVEIRNSKNPSAPDMSAVKQQFDVVANGDASRNQSSTYIINGRVTQQNLFSHVYQYRLTPKLAGKLIIPSITASIDGKVLTSDQVALRVLEIEKQDLVLVEIETSHAKVFPTQPFTITLRVFVQPLPNGADRDPLTPLRRQPPHLQINWADPPTGLSADEKSQWLQPLMVDDGVGFTLNDIGARTGSFFDSPKAAVFKILNGRDFRNGIDGKPIRYFVYELARTFTPEKTGEYSFGPATIKGTFAAGVEGNGYSARRLVASSQPVSVEVREVPTPRPATYCGGIGEYKVKASASPMKLRVGDPLTLTLELERGSQSGSLELVSAPDLSAIPQLMNDFDLIDKDPTGRVEGTVKKFAYAMRPKRANVMIPSMTVQTFDPKKEEFLAVETVAIPLDVSAAERVSAVDLIGSMPSAGSSTIKSQSQGIFQNITDPKEVRDERVNVAAWSQSTLGIWSIAGVLIAIVTYNRRKFSDSAGVRRQRARRSATNRLTEARRSLASGQSVEAMRHVRSAIIGLVADTGNRIAEGLTTSDVGECLSAAAVPMENQKALVQLLESIESAEYGATQSADVAAAIEFAAAQIARVASYLERGF